MIIFGKFLGALDLKWQMNYTGPGPLVAPESAPIEEDDPAMGKKGGEMGQSRRNESGNWRGGKKEERNQGDAAAQ